MNSNNPQPGQQSPQVEGGLGISDIAKIPVNPPSDGANGDVEKGVGTSHIADIPVEAPAPETNPAED